MTSFIRSQFAIQAKPNLEFLNQQQDSDSEDEEQKQLKMLQLENQKELKKQKKQIDIEIIKQELQKRPSKIIEKIAALKKNKSEKKRMQTLNNPIIPTSAILIEQFNLLRAIKEIRQDVPPELINRIFSEFRYENIPPITPVYKQGDQNKKFYIIIEGKVVILKPKQKMVGSNKIEVINNTEEKIENDPLGLKSTFPDYIVVKVLFQGDSFGEAAIKLETARTSTVYTLDQTHFLVLDENSYLDLIDPYVSQTLDKKIKYFQQFPLFQNVDQTDYMGIVLESKLINYKAGQIIYEEGDKTKYLYFIISGEIELLKTIKNKQIILSSYGENQQFGEIEILMKENRFTQAKVIAPRLKVYRIRKRLFFDNLGSYLSYENMKKHSAIIYKHWLLISNTAKTQNDETYGQNDIKINVHKMLSKSVKKKSSTEQLSQLKIFSELTENNIQKFKNDNQVSNRAYSQTLQKYQAQHSQKIVIPKLATQEETIQKLIHQNSNTSITNDIDQLDDSIEMNVETNRSSKAPSLSYIKRDSNHKISLPSIYPSLQVIGPKPQSLNIVLESIEKLPQIPKDNLLLSLMYQQAYRAENPNRKATEIKKEISASFRKEYHQTEIPLSCDNRHKSSQNKVSFIDIFREKKKSYVNFVQQKKIYSQNY